MTVTVRSAIDIVFVLCSGEPASNKNYTRHDGRVWNDVKFEMIDEYTELPQEGLDHFWYNTEEESFIAVQGARVEVFDYHNSELFNEWLAICKKEAVADG